MATKTIDRSGKGKNTLAFIVRFSNYGCKKFYNFDTSSLQVPPFRQAVELKYSETSEMQRNNAKSWPVLSHIKLFYYYIKCYSLLYDNDLRFNY